MSRERIDLLVHFGCGECREIEQHLERAERIVLVEPDAETCLGLKRRFEGQSRIEIIEASVGDGETSRGFVVRNVRDLSGNYAAKSITKYFPGLREVESVASVTSDAANLLESIIGASDCSVELLIDVNGAELEVLRSLEKGKCISKLARVVVYCGNEPLFEGALAEDRVTNFLETFGTVASRGVGYFRRVMVEVESATPSFAAQELELVPGEAEVKSDQMKLVELQEEYREYKRVSGETETRLREEVRSCRERILESSVRVESLEKSNATMDARYEELVRQYALLADEEMPELRRDLAVALRSRAMADADLRALRAQHEATVLAKREQEELLSLLSDRLGRASAYLAAEESEQTGSLSVDFEIDSTSEPEIETLPSKSSAPEGENEAR